MKDLMNGASLIQKSVFGKKKGSSDISSDKVNIK